MSKIDKIWFKKYETIGRSNSSDYVTAILTKKGFESRKEVFLRLFSKNKFHPNIHILDMGCGVGLFTNTLYELGFKNIIGIDYSKNLIKRAKLKNKDIQYLVGNIHKIGLSDSSFDVVICMGVFQCISQEKRAVSELSRVLKKGGGYL